MVTVLWELAASSLLDELGAGPGARVPQAALIAESFSGRLRYSGASLGYQLASVIAGGPAPLIATWLYGTYQSAYAIAWYIAACAVVTLIALAMMKDYTGRDIERD